MYSNYVLSNITDCSAPNIYSLAWLLPIQERIGEDLGHKTFVRVNSTPFYNALYNYLINPGNVLPSEEFVTDENVHRLMSSLNIFENKKIWRKKCLSNDLDWIHAQFMRLVVYRAAIDELSNKFIVRTDTRINSLYARMAASLGQLGVSPLYNNTYCRGDAHLKLNNFINALKRWMPKKGSTLSLENCALRSTEELTLSPFRFSKALSMVIENQDKLNNMGYPFPFALCGSARIRQPFKTIHTSVVHFSYDSWEYSYWDYKLIRLNDYNPPEYIERVF